MALILCLETSTEVCSVALFRDQAQLAHRESYDRNVHSARLTTFIEEIFTDTGISCNDLDAVAVSKGPGSYTGLRIGVAAAKGLCYAIGKPLIAVPTLQAMAVGIEQRRDQKSKIKNQNVLFCPMIDARRMEVYCGLYDMENHEVREVRAEIIDESSFGEYLSHDTMIFAGEGAAKCKPLLENHPNAVFLDGFRASAVYMISLAEEKFREKFFENLAYFEPFYLKDFVAGKPRVKGLA